MRSLRERLTYANVVATLALLVAVSTGGAWAASTFVTGRDVKNGSLTGADLKRGSITGAKLRRDTLGGAQIRESRLAKVPSAARADSAGTATRALSADALQGVALSGLLGSSHVLAGSASTAQVGTLLFHDPRTGLDVRTGTAGSVRIANAATDGSTVDGHAIGYADFPLNIAGVEIKVGPAEQVDVSFNNSGLKLALLVFQQRDGAAALQVTCTQRSPQLSCVGVG